MKIGFLFTVYYEVDGVLRMSEMAVGIPKKIDDRRYWTPIVMDDEEVHARINELLDKVKSANEAA